MWTYSKFSKILYNYLQKIWLLLKFQAPNWKLANIWAATIFLGIHLQKQSKKVKTSYWTSSETNHFLYSLCIYINVFSFDLFSLILLLLLLLLLCFFSPLPFSLFFVLTWGITMKIRRFCPFYAIPAIVNDIHICLR